MRRLTKLLRPAGISVLGALSFTPLGSAQATDAACPATTVEENKALAERWLEGILGGWNPRAVDALLADDHIHHAGYGPADIEGRERYKAYLEAYWAASFSDPQVTLEQLVAEGDRVAVQWTLRATYQQGHGGTAEPGTSVSWTGLSILRIGCAQVAETWIEADGVSRLRQIGALPSEERGGAGEGD